MRLLTVMLATAIVCLTACKSRGGEPSTSTKDLDQIEVLTSAKAFCKDGSVYKFAPVGQVSYSVTRPDGTIVVVPESDLLRTVCPPPGDDVIAGKLLKEGKYISIKGEAQVKDRCDMKFVAFYDDAGNLVGANASAAALESNTACGGALNVYSFTCSGVSQAVTCSGQANSGSSIVLNEITAHAFARSFDGSVHTYVNADAPTAPSAGTAPIVTPGVYKTSSANLCAQKVVAFYDGSKLSHLAVERTATNANACSNGGRNVYACVPTATGPECTSTHGDTVRRIRSFAGNAYKYVSPDGTVSTYVLQ